MIIHRHSRSQIKQHCLKCFICFASFSFTGVVFANPVLSQIVSGNVSVQQTPSTTYVNQVSKQAILNWLTFNIGPNEWTHFQQPAGGIALNHISPLQGPSQIFGHLTATGEIILENPAGIFFGNGSYVNVGGLVATTAQIKNSDFSNGYYHFTGTPAGSSVINQGTIIAAQHGLVALVGANVENDGTIKASLGKVALASGSAFTVDFGGDGLVNFSVDNRNLTDAKGHPVAGSIINTGTVSVAPQTASAILDNSINMKGIAQATSVAKVGGDIILGGSELGTVKVSGKLYASNKRKGGKGGNITITGQHILVNNDAVIDASGDSGGGNIYIGGNAHGAGPLPNAATVTMMPTASISANAITNGNGGNIVLWSNDATQAYGSLSAQGGALAGNGGYIETSGSYLDVNGLSVNTTAPKGLTGTWLLDPTDLTIENNGGNNSNIVPGSMFEGDPNSNASILDVGNLITALGSSNITVLTTAGGTGTGNGDIIVNNAISNWGSNSLALSAYRDITLNAAISNTGTGNTGGLTLQANNAGAFDLSSLHGIVTAPSGTIDINGPVSIFYNPSAYTSPTSYTNSGTGTLTAYMLINTPAELQTLSTTSSLWANSFALSGNIDASGLSGFTPIGNSTTSFTGNFNGQNNTINNLTINLPTTDDVGLFGNIDTTGSVSNLTLSNANITGNQAVGILAGTNSGSINNVTVTGSSTVVGEGNNVPLIANEGGLVGINSSSGSINNSQVIGGSVTSPQSVLGGLIGDNFGSVNDSGTSANVTGILQVGGLIGENESGATLSGTLTVGNAIVTGQRNLGGFIGENAGDIDGTGNNFSTNATLTVTPAGINRGIGMFIGTNDTGTLNDINVTSGTFSTTIGEREGGVVGDLEGGSISNSSNSIAIAGGIDVGGLVGWNGGFNITNSQNSGSVSGSIVSVFEATGGLVGENMGTISGSSSTGTVHGTNNVGGLVGQNDDQITNSSVFSSNVTATTNVGGLVGVNTSQISGSTVSSSNVMGNSSVGGLIGLNQSSDITAQIINSQSSANVTGNNAVGGFIGNNNHGLLDGSSNNLYGSGTISFSGGFSHEFGGFVGLNDGTIQNVNLSSPNIQDISLPISTIVGGLVGENQGFGTINNSSVTNNVTANATVGGLVGENLGVITGSSESNGTVTGSVIVGGLVGNNFNSISNSNSSGGSVHGNASLGGLVGVNNNSVDSSNSSKTVTGNSSIAFDVGGLVGDNASSITNSSSSGGVSGGTAVGGLAGLNTASISDSSSSSVVSGVTNIGGIAGDNESSIIGASSFSPSISGTTNIGGLAGLNNGSVGSSNNFSNVSGSTNVGGIAGDNASSITNSSSTGSILGGTAVGGLAGLNTGSVDSSNDSFSNVNGSTNVGGVVGDNESSITNSSSVSSTVSGTNGVGGLAGFNNGSISNSNASDNVSGTRNIGGLIGVNSSNGTFLNIANTGSTSGSQTVGRFIGDLIAGAGDNFTISGNIITETSSGSGVNTITGDNIFTTWDITGIDTGSVEGILGGFSNIQNLIGGNAGNTFNFIGNAGIGTINGGSLTATNRIDYSGDSKPVSVIMSNIANGTGQGFNANSLSATNEFNEIGNFVNINNIIGNGRGYLGLPGNSVITFNPAITPILFDGQPHSLSGTVSDPLNFADFLFVFPSLSTINGSNPSWQIVAFSPNQLLITTDPTVLVDEDITTTVNDMLALDVLELSKVKIIPNCKGLSQQNGNK